MSETEAEMIARRLTPYRRETIHDRRGSAQAMLAALRALTGGDDRG